MASQKLAEPFLHPLIPLTYNAKVDPDPDHGENGYSAATSSPKSLGKARYSPSPCSPAYSPAHSSRGESCVADLFAVQEKIRRLAYCSYSEFLCDLTSLRNETLRLIRSMDSTYEGPSDASEHCLVQSFDSMAYNAFHPSYDKKTRLVGIEERIAAAGDVGAGLGLGRGSSVALLEERMLAVWRLECLRPLTQYFVRSASAVLGFRKDGKVSFSADVVAVSPRSFRGWCDYVKTSRVVPGPHNDHTLYGAAAEEVSPEPCTRLVCDLLHLVAVAVICVYFTLLIYIMPIDADHPSFVILFCFPTIPWY
jgi:hypothetical protein